MVSLARRWLAVGALALVLSGHSAIAAWQQTHSLMINTSDSLPNWAFFVSKGSAPASGDHVFFAPPRTPLLLEHFGEDHGPFGKQVLGMPGDVVSHDGAIVRINGKPVARMKPLTRTGKPLTPGPIGTVPGGCYYAGTDHPHGFDSRYAEIGFVCARQIVGTGVPVL